MDNIISFVIPCYGSEKTIERVIKEIKNTFNKQKKYKYEIIAVNDCSPDNVWDVLLKLAKKDKQIKLIQLTKNMNRPGAVMAGLGKARGEFICIMDDDGQCPMEEFWNLLKPLENGYDVSCAGYPSRKQSLFKDFGTLVNRKMTEIILDKPKDIQFTNFMVIKGFVAKEMCNYKNPYPYVSGLILRITRKICCVPMEERERFSGSTNFTLAKLIGLWMNGFTAFSVKPLRISSVIGVLSASIGFIYGLIIVIRKIIRPDILVGYSSLMATFLFMTGIIMLMLGLIGEYIGRIYICINNSPQYIIRETVNINEKK